MDTPQQNSGASGVTQAVAPAPSAPITAPLPTTQAHPAPSSQDLVPRSYLEAATQQAIARKGKVKTLKANLGQAQATLTEVTTERDKLRADAEANQSKLKAYADRMAEAALIQSLTSEGLTQDAARYLLPALRAHVEVDPSTFEVKLKEDEIKKAAAALKPAQGQPAPTAPGGRAMALHSTIAAARTPAAPDREMSPRERLRAEADALQRRGA